MNNTTPDQPYDYDYLIIGSGFGGSVSLANWQIKPLLGVGIVLDNTFSSGTD